MYELIICEKSQAARLIAESLADDKPVKKHKQQHRKKSMKQEQS